MGQDKPYGQCSDPLWRLNEVQIMALVQREKPQKFFLNTSPLFGSKSTISRFGERFRDGQYSLVSFLFAVLLLTVLPPCPAICKSGRHLRFCWLKIRMIMKLAIMCSYTRWCECSNRTRQLLSCPIWAWTTTTTIFFSCFYTFSTFGCNFARCCGLQIEVAWSARQETA